MENLNFEVYNDNGDMVAQIQVFDDGSYWVETNHKHKVAVNEIEDEEENTTTIEFDGEAYAKDIDKLLGENIKKYTRVVTD